MIVKKISKEKLDKVSKCTCNYGVITCPGCDGAIKIPPKSWNRAGRSLIICAGCNGTGVRTCGKCGGL